MKFLINIQSDSELITYEAMSLAFVLASFEHLVTLYFSHQSIDVLTNSQSRLYGMVQSLELYDIPKAWIDKTWDITQLDHQIASVVHHSDKIDLQAFDSVLVF